MQMPIYSSSEDFLEDIRAYLRANHITQDELGRRIHLSRKATNRLLQSPERFSLKDLERVGRVLGLAGFEFRF
jgi:transcriptional regulator with XRE-family HTH domain